MGSWVFSVDGFIDTEMERQGGRKKKIKVQFEHFKLRFSRDIFADLPEYEDEPGT